ncbi:MAG: CARDB domain-containing protein [Candidatus Komeilibacteria bacterium]
MKIMKLSVLAIAFIVMQVVPIAAVQATTTTTTSATTNVASDVFLDANDVAYFDNMVKEDNIVNISLVYDVNEDGIISKDDVESLRYKIFFYDAYLSQDGVLSADDVNYYSDLIMQFSSETLANILGGSEFDWNGDGEINVLDPVDFVNFIIRYNFVDGSFEEETIAYHPDLAIVGAITIITGNDTSYEVGDTVSMRLKIQNSGDQNVKSFKIRAVDTANNDEHFLTRTINQLVPANSTVEVFFGSSWINPNGIQHNHAGVYKLKITVDPFNELNEVNRSNNDYYLDIRVNEANTIVEPAPEAPFGLSISRDWTSYLGLWKINLNWYNKNADMFRVYKKVSDTASVDGNYEVETDTSNKSMNIYLKADNDSYACFYVTGLNKVSGMSRSDWPESGPSNKICMNLFDSDNDVDEPNEDIIKNGDDRLDMTDVKYFEKYIATRTLSMEYDINNDGTLNSADADYLANQINLLDSYLNKDNAVDAEDLKVFANFITQFSSDTLANILGNSLFDRNNDGEINVLDITVLTNFIQQYDFAVNQDGKSPVIVKPVPKQVVKKPVVKKEDSGLREAYNKLQTLVSRLRYHVSQLEKDVINKEKELAKYKDQSLTNRLKGRILLQAEENGEAWYVDADTEKKFYLKDGDAAYTALQAFGLGITNADLAQIPTEGSNATGNSALIERLKGKILLQVEGNGEAFYVNPETGQRHYLRNGAEAYRIMRELSLGITNDDLRKIEVGEFTE